MVCCVIGGALSAVPRQWVGAILAGRAGGSDPRDVGEAVRLFRPQVPMVIISTNADPVWLNDCGVPVVAGEWAGHTGMLLAALEWTARNAWETPWVAMAPARGAPVPPDAVARPAAAVSGSAAQAACVAEGGRLVLELGLWPVRLRQDLRRVVDGAGERSLAEWARGFAVAVIEGGGLQPLLPATRP